MTLSVSKHAYSASLLKPPSEFTTLSVSKHAYSASLLKPPSEFISLSVSKHAYSASLLKPPGKFSAAPQFQRNLSSRSNSHFTPPHTFKALVRRCIYQIVFLIMQSLVSQIQLAILVAFIFIGKSTVFPRKLADLRK